MEGIFDQTSGQLVAVFGPQLGRILLAVAVLVGGWVVALLASWAARAGLGKTTLDNRLAAWIVGEEKGEKLEVERWVGRGVFWTVIAFAVIGFFSALGLAAISGPIQAGLNRIFEYLPRLLAAGLLLLAAWAVATVARRVVGVAASRFGERVGDEAGLEAGERPALGQALADAVYWLVFLLFLLPILDTLGLSGLLLPLQSLLDRVLSFLPSILAAGVILAAGWFIARVVQRIATNLLAAMGADGLPGRLNLGTVIGERRLSGLLGTIVYVLILIPVLISALNALQLDAVTRPASDMLARVLEAVPAIFAAALLLGLAYVAGRLVATLLANVLTGAGFDGLLAKLGVSRREGSADSGARTPSAVVGELALVAVMFFASIEASRLLGFEALATLLSSFVVFAGQVALGLVVFGVGLYLADVAASAVRSSGSQQAGLLAVATRVSVIVLAGAIGLRQMGLANEIIELAFGLLLGSIAVAVAVAFGVGGRDLAARQLEGWVKGLQSKS
jgi:hypothetical protein